MCRTLNHMKLGLRDLIDKIMHFRLLYKITNVCNLINYN